MVMDEEEFEDGWDAITVRGDVLYLAFLCEQSVWT